MMAQGLTSRAGVAKGGHPGGVCTHLFMLTRDLKLDEKLRMILAQNSFRDGAIFPVNLDRMEFAAENFD